MHGMYSTWHVECFFFHFDSIILFPWILWWKKICASLKRAAYDSYSLKSRIVEESSHQYNLVIRYFLRNDICFLHANQYCFFFAKSELDFFVARVCIGSIENVPEWQTPFFFLVSNTVWSHFSHQFMMFCVQWIFNLASQQRKRNDNHLSNDSQPKENHENWYCAYEKEI